MMTVNPADRWATNRYSPEVVDRVLLGLCAAIWLVLLGTSVAATVALVDLGRGFHTPAKNPHTGVLYIVIGVSALIILAAVPVLLRARGSAMPSRAFRLAPRRPAPPTGRSAAPRADVDRALLRGITDLTSVIGAGLIAVAAGTYLMAVGKDTGAWVGYGIAGAIALAMPVVPWLHLRRLRGLLDAPVRLG